MEVVCGGSMFEWRNNISIAESGGRIITATPGAERGSPFVCALYVRVSILVPGATGDRGLAHRVLCCRVRFREGCGVALKDRALWTRASEQGVVVGISVFVDEKWHSLPRRVERQNHVGQH